MEVILYRGYNPFTKYHGHPIQIPPHVQTFFIFTLTLGRLSNLTNIFQMG